MVEEASKGGSFGLGFTKLLCVLGTSSIFCFGGMYI